MRRRTARTPARKTIGEKKKIGALAEREFEQKQRAGTLRPAIAAANCDVDNDLPPATVPATSRPRPRASDWILGGFVLGEAAVLTYARLRSRLKKLRGPEPRSLGFSQRVAAASQ